MENQKRKINILVETDGSGVRVVIDGRSSISDSIKACCCVVEAFSEVLADEMRIGKKVAFAGLSNAIAKYKNEYNNKED